MPDKSPGAAIVEPRHASFERYLNDPEKDPEHKHDVEICVPVRPL